MTKRLILYVCALCATAVLAQEGSSSAKPTVIKTDTTTRDAAPTGFRFFDQHLIIRPYVSLSVTYDSNIDSDKKQKNDDVIFRVNPGFDLVWYGERWKLDGRAWYDWDLYCDYHDRLGKDSYGEELAYAWTTSDPAHKGWSLMLSERYAYVSQSDNLQDGGRGYWRDREAVTAVGAMERRFSSRWHVNLSAQYYWIDYKRDGSKYLPMYSWSQWAIAAETGWVFTKWTDLIISAGYSRYDYSQYAGRTQAYQLMAGLATRATERIQYRALAGISQLDYGRNAGVDRGWVYQLSANWKATRKLGFSVRGESHYQPSERAVGSANHVYSIGAGATYRTLGDKGTVSFDLAYRREDTVYTQQGGHSDYYEDFLSVRLQLNYMLNRWVSLFGSFIYEQEWNQSKDDYEYDRIRATLGVRVHY